MKTRATQQVFHILILQSSMTTSSSKTAPQLNAYVLTP